MELSTSTTPQSVDRAHRRIRHALLFTFVTLVALAGFQAWYNGRLERVRALDADLVGLASTQRIFCQQVGRLAALAEGGELRSNADAELISEAIERSRSDALLVETLLAAQRGLSGRDEAPVAAALSRWQDARERLWYRADTMSLHVGSHDAFAVTHSASALQAEVEPALAAADLLYQRLQEASQSRATHQARMLQWGVGLTLLVLAAVVMLVAVPTARALRMQVQRLSTQTRELQRLAQIVARTDNGVVVTGLDGRIEWVNDGFVRLTGWSADDVRGRPVDVALHSEHNDPADVAPYHEALRTGRAARFEVLTRRKHASDGWFEVDLQPMLDEEGRHRGYVFLATDVTGRHELSERLRLAASTDALTGLPNRAAAIQRLHRAIGHARRHPGYGFAVLFMDFDRFKQINDTLGHHEGDELLKQMAQRIELALRPGDAVAHVSGEHTAARLGGDEFVVVLDGVSRVEDARAITDRLLRDLAEPYVIDGRSVQSTVSIGVVVARDDARSPDELLRDADTAMYEAKRAGRDCCMVFDPAMHERVVRQLEIENDLRRALRAGELFVVYQPIVALPGGRATGVEALVRWRHPSRGVVTPGEFIAVAEEVGLIDQIGEFVLRESCARFADWRARLGPRAPGQLNVNLSRAQLRSPGLVEQVRATLAEHELAPRLLQLEVTETLAAQDEAVQATLRALKQLGVRLALDDFGTGYSSLACLHLLPVDTVKIDRSFIAHAESVEYHRVLIEATIRVAQSLDMVTVAEGIETAGQAALMTRLRCDHGQGWLYGRPVEAAELERRITEAAAA
ncbi:putative bifunctional diguanylate cyclase/phosphodiesterase [Rubrivivax gelatinosus]|uniref:putative bifunctional diguanylate cyclase/phosphodiesterase n=1 Tax=Rubrivivax gelatinosus TaxID=28068 RepID=UPI00030FE28B|nr:GGDEF and EAL domain-containing protein [Rubrivivax gelatinosus]MBG6081534.1 diguanylate cyclase (GGDEF)-like protein/PAS domain S-box-containing protein [Rubrivivax gelatinosus]